MHTLRVGAALPDPPFNGCGGRPGDGLDIDLVTEVARILDVDVEFVPYQGGDFEGIFEGLRAGTYDCVASGAAVTENRCARALFAPPYLVCGQALAVDTRRLPGVRGIDDLAGLTIGVQRGSTASPVAERLVRAGRAGRVRRYDCTVIGTAVADLTTGGCDVLMKLGPALAELVKRAEPGRGPGGGVGVGVGVVQRGITVEDIALAVGPSAHDLLDRIAAAQRVLERDGTLQRLRRKWLGNPYRDQSLAAL